MTIRKILTAPDPLLLKKSEPIEKVDKEILSLSDDMLETMYNADGIGLAAAQIGVLKRITVIDLQIEGDDTPPYFIANPEITWVSDEDASLEEGCLSIPENYGDVIRPKEVKIKYLDRDNEYKELHADGLLAACIQHEMDHMDGILFIDHLSNLKRNMILRKLTKLKRQHSKM